MSPAVALPPPSFAHTGGRFSSSKRAPSDGLPCTLTALPSPDLLGATPTINASHSPAASRASLPSVAPSSVLTTFAAGEPSAADAPSAGSSHLRFFSAGGGADMMQRGESGRRRGGATSFEFRAASQSSNCQRGELSLLTSTGKSTQVQKGITGTETGLVSVCKNRSDFRHPLFGSESPARRSLVSPPPKKARRPRA